jgi:hypothetical protein
MLQRNNYRRGANRVELYVFFTATRQISSPFLRTASHTLSVHLIQELLMDIVFIAASAGLWGLMVLMVWGFKKLEKPQGGRP